MWDRTVYDRGGMLSVVKMLKVLGELISPGLPRVFIDEILMSQIDQLKRELVALAWCGVYCLPNSIDGHLARCLTPTKEAPITSIAKRLAFSYHLPSCKCAISDYEATSIRGKSAS